MLFGLLYLISCAVFGRLRFSVALCIELNYVTLEDFRRMACSAFQHG